MLQKTKSEEAEEIIAEQREVRRNLLILTRWLNTVMAVILILVSLVSLGSPSPGLYYVLVPAAWESFLAWKGWQLYFRQCNQR